MGYPVGEYHLVDIESDATNGRGYLCALKAGADEGAADFVAGDVYVIWPLDGR